MYGYTQGIEQPGEFIVPKKQRVGGSIIGILLLDVPSVMVPGDVNNATTYNFPVLYKVLKGIDPERIGQADPTVLTDVIREGKELVEEGARAITSNCGYFGNYQKEVATALGVPVLLSSLLQIPFIIQMLQPDQKVAVICANSEALTDSLFKTCGVNPSTIVAAGSQDLPESKSLWLCTGRFDSHKIEQELIGLAKDVINNNPNIGAFLLECSEMAPYAWSIQKAINLPVFDFTTMINFIYSALVRRPFAGYI